MGFQGGNGIEQGDPDPPLRVVRLQCFGPRKVWELRKNLKRIRTKKERSSAGFVNSEVSDHTITQGELRS